MLLLERSRLIDYVRHSLVDKGREVFVASLLGFGTVCQTDAIGGEGGSGSNLDRSATIGEHSMRAVVAGWLFPVSLEGFGKVEGIVEAELVGRALNSLSIF